MRSARFASIIIAAGSSSRMGSFKPLLPFGESTAVETLIKTYRDAGIQEVILVVGHRGPELMALLRSLDITCVMNESYSYGMYSSILKGLENLKEGFDGFFIQPVDVALVKKHTLKQLINSYQNTCKGIIYPTFDGLRGHPPLIDIKYRDCILKGNGVGGLRTLLDSYSLDALCLPVFDEAVLLDMDTREDYQKLLEYFERNAPNRRECMSILKSHQVPQHIIRHCEEVARISMALLEGIGACGDKLKAATLEAAALLHDIARLEDNHAEKGGKIITEIGYAGVGKIISSHIDIAVDEKKPITENEILFLADMLVYEDKFMPLEIRRQIYQQRYRNNFEALIKIRERYDTAEKIKRKIEKLAGQGIMYG